MIDIKEYPQPMCELHDTDRDEYVLIKTAEDAEAVVESLTRMLEEM